MTHPLHPIENDLLDRIRLLAPQNAPTFAGTGTPNVDMGTVTLVNTMMFRAYLITAHGRRDLFVANAGTHHQRKGHTTRVDATGYDDDQCRRVAEAYRQRLEAAAA